MTTTLDRRSFVKVTAVAGAGLALAFHLPGCTPAEEEGPDTELNAFLTVKTDGSVVVTSKHMEMGQGAYTGLATILAEEMDADWSKVTVVGAPGDVKRYANTQMGMQLTGGSSAISNSFEQMRKAGAAARAMLVLSAAALWKVDAAGITVAEGVVHHKDSGKSAHFGKLAAGAALIAPPADVTLKEPKNWGLIGKDRLPRVDAYGKSTGTATFTQDIKLPGMLTAVVAHPPRFGAKVKSFTATAAKAVPGVVDVVQVPSGVAVLANDFWSAKKGREALTVQWDEKDAEDRGSEQLWKEYESLSRIAGKDAGKRGNAPLALSVAPAVIKATYKVPFLSHASMEPLNCVAQVNPGRCELWYGAQGHTMDQMAVGRALGLQPEQVTINSLYAGGSFGRRANPQSDYVVEAALIAKATNGRPVKLVWTREDDMDAGWWRPMYLHAVKGGVGGDGKIQGWHHRVVGQSIFAEMGMGSDVDRTSIEGVNDLHYNVTDLATELYTTKLGVPIQWWRSVGHTHTAFVVESFMDELAAQAKRDPVAFRLDHLDQDSRYAKVLRLVAEKAGWGSAVPEGRARGVAVHESFSTVVAEVAEVSLRPDKTVQVHKVTAAVDCGLAVNPDIIRAQVEGAVMYGLSAALHGKVTLTDGKVDQHNFDKYTVLRMNEAPVVDVHILPSDNAPTGIGEPGTPPIAPAVANAVFTLTGMRVRELPFGAIG